MKREDALQMAVASLLDASGLWWFHPANGEHRNPITGAKLKRMGVKAGMPDVMILDDPCADVGTGPEWCGLAIELKAPDAKGRRPKPRANQLEWHERLRKCGWRVEVCYSLDEVIGLLRECYPGRLLA